MELFDVKDSVLSSEDLKNGVDFVTEFSSELSELENRITGSENETACARTIRKRLAEETEAKVRLEAFRGYPFLGRGSLSFYGLWYLLCYTLYFVSFIGNRLTGILLSLLALGVFAVGCTGMCLMYFSKRHLRGMLSQKVSYNVVSEAVSYVEKPKKERVIIIADNHDAALGSFFKDTVLMSKLAHFFVPFTAFVFVVFCIVKMAIGTEGANATAKITALVVVPAVLGVMGILATIARFSPFERHAIQNNGVATSVAMATFAYFAEQPELIPDDVRLVYASFGGENSGHGGSAAFVKSHPEFAGAYVICLGNIEGGELKIAERNAVRKIDYSTPLISVIRSSAHEQKIDICAMSTDTLSQKLKSIHGHISDEFALCGNPTATILTEHSDGRLPVRNELEKLFSVTVGTVKRLMGEKSAADDDTPPITPTSADMVIQAAIGK